MTGPTTNPPTGPGPGSARRDDAAQAAAFEGVLCDLGRLLDALAQEGAGFAASHEPGSWPPLSWNPPRALQEPLRALRALARTEPARAALDALRALLRSPTLSWRVVAVPLDPAAPGLVRSVSVESAGADTPGRAAPWLVTTRTSGARPEPGGSQGEGRALPPGWIQRPLFDPPEGPSGSSGRGPGWDPLAPRSGPV